MPKQYAFDYDELYTLLNNAIGQFWQYLNAEGIDENEAQIRAVRDVFDSLDAELRRRGEEGR
jgi:hypothetical protein